MSNLFTAVRGDRAVNYLVEDGWLAIDIDHDDPPGTWWPLAPSAPTIAAVRTARRSEDHQTIRRIARERYTADLRAAYRSNRSVFDAIRDKPGVVILDAEHDDTFRSTLVDVLVRLGHRYISPCLHGTGYAQPVVVWVDTETGGVTPKSALLEIAAFATAGLDGEILGRYHALVHPGVLPVDEQAASKNGYSKQAWIHAHHEHVSVAGFSKWVRQFCDAGLLGAQTALKVAGYNPSFDLRMLGHAAERISDPWLNQLLKNADATDVLKLHRPKIGSESKKLTEACAWAGIDFWGPEHGAEPDICATRRLHLKLAGVRT